MRFRGSEVSSQEVSRASVRGAPGGGPRGRRGVGCAACRSGLPGGALRGWRAASRSRTLGPGELPQRGAQVRLRAGQVVFAVGSAGTGVVELVVAQSLAPARHDDRGVQFGHGDGNGGGKQHHRAGDEAERGPERGGDLPVAIHAGVNRHGVDEQEFLQTGIGLHAEPDGGSEQAGDQEEADQGYLARRSRAGFRAGASCGRRGPAGNLKPALRRARASRRSRPS